MTKSTRERLLKIVKWLWIIIVLFAAIHYAYRNFSSIISQIETFWLPGLLFAFIFLVIAKLLLAELTRHSLTGSSWSPQYYQILYINSVTQMGKYLPGGIWHFVGKIGFYKASDVSYKQATKALIIENIWLLGSAFTIGMSLILYSTPGILLDILQISPSPGLVTALATLFVIFWLGIATVTVMVLTSRFVPIKTVTVVLLQLGVWILLGLSLSSLFFNQVVTWSSILTTIGGFSLSYAIGYVSIFAPSGIGIREVMLTLLLTSILLPSEIVFVATLSRLIWIIAEVLLGVFSELVIARMYPLPFANDISKSRDQTEPVPGLHR